MLGLRCCGQFNSGRQGSDGYVFVVVHETSLSPFTEPEWIEIELTADSGDNIPIRPSFQPLRGMEDEVANGQSLPNLGERRLP